MTDVKMQWPEVVKVDQFKYQGSTNQSNIVHKLYSEESIGKVAWVDMSVGDDL